MKVSADRILDSRETFLGPKHQKWIHVKHLMHRDERQKDSRETRLKHEVPRRRRRPRSLPDAEPAENLIEHVLDIHAPRDPAQRIRRAAKILRAQLHII